MLIRKVNVRIQQYLDFLDKNKYRTIQKLQVKVAETDKYNYTVPSDLQTQEVTFPFSYGKEKFNFWFFTSFNIPEEYQQEEVYLYAPTEADSLVFINGNPVGAVNPFHLKLKLTEEEKRDKLHVAIEAYAGHVIPGYHPMHEPRVLLTLGRQIQGYPIIFPTCELLIKNKAVYNLYYDVLVLFDIANQLDENSLRRNEILRDLYYTLIQIHFVSDPKTLEEESKIARNKLQKLFEKKNGSTAPKIYTIGHAHIDHAWLWPLGETVRKSARTFSNMTRLADEYPDFVFIQSQPAQMEFVKNNYPYIFEKIVQVFKKGQWEPNGGMYVEADTNIPSGESLIRQFLIGKSLTEEYFNYYGDTLWLPDVFGYSANLPQILKGCAIDYFVTSKISWNDTTRFPYDTFNWSGIDGSVIKAHFLTSSYEGFASVKAITEGWNRIRHKEIQNGLVKPFGEGDGGGGSTRSDIEVIKRIDDLEGSPKTKWSKVSNALKEIFSNAHNLPTWQGELYLELHRGTYTTIANTKKYNRMIEQLLRNVEFFGVLCLPDIRKSMGFTTGHDYPKELINRYWKKLLTHQFHDIIPGSSINQVNKEALVTYQSVVKEINDLTKELQDFYLSENTPQGSKNSFLVLNSLSWLRKQLISIPISLNDKKTYSIKQGTDSKPCQIYQDLNGSTHLLGLVEAQELGFSKFSVEEKYTDVTSPFVWEENTLKTPFYKVKFTSAMQMEKLYLEKEEFNYIEQGKHFNTLQIAEDMPVTWDAWDIEWDTFNQKIIDLNIPDKIEIISQGPLFFQIRLEYSFSNSTLEQDIIFYAHDERIDFTTKVHWQEEHKVLRVIFPSSIYSDQVTCEIQNGHVKRPTIQNRDHERAMFEICAHKWIKLDDTQRGFALLNDSKYGHNVIRNQLGLTLLRSPKHPDEFADIGEHIFTYSILPYKEDSLVKVIQKGYELNNKIPVFNGPITNLTAFKKFLRVSNKKIIVESIKYAESGEGWILRLYEVTGSYNKTVLTFLTKFKNIFLTNMVEGDKQTLGSNLAELTLEFNPFECKTLLIT